MYTPNYFPAPPGDQLHACVTIGRPTPAMNDQGTPGRMLTVSSHMQRERVTRLLVSAPWKSLPLFVSICLHPASQQEFTGGQRHHTVPSRRTAASTNGRGITPDTAEVHRTRHRARQYPLRLRIEPNRTSAGRRSHTGGSYYTNSSPSARHTIPCRQLISRVDASFFSCAEDDECASSSTSIASWRWTFCTDNRDPCWFVRCYKKIDKVLELRWFTGTNTISSKANGHPPSRMGPRPRRTLDKPEGVTEVWRGKSSINTSTTRTSPPHRSLVLDSNTHSNISGTKRYGVITSVGTISRWHGSLSNSKWSSI